MSPQDLEQYIISDRDPIQLAQRFECMTVKDRSKLSKTVRHLNRKYSSLDEVAPLPKEALKGIDAAKLRGIIDSNINLATYALAPRSTLKNYYAWSSKGEKAFDKIIRDRAPEWIDHWIDDELSKEFGSILDFPTLRGWIKDALCEKPDHPRYFDLFASYLAHAPRDWKSNKKEKFETISQRLLKDPELLEDILPSFDMELFWFQYDPRKHDHNLPPAYEVWPEAIIKLSDMGALNRQLILNKTLSSLWHDFPQTQYAGRYALHKELKPTLEERSARESEYYALLAHKVGHVVKFALSFISQLEKDGKLNNELFCSEVSQVFYQPGKGNSITAIKLLKKLLKSDPKKKDTALKAVVEALRNEHMDVQALALDLLEAEDVLSKELKAVVAEAHDFVNPVLQSRLLALYGGKSLTSEQPHTEIDVQSIASSLSNRVQDALSVTDMLTDQDLLYAPISNDILAHDLLPKLTPLAPVKNISALLDLIAHNMEGVQNADEIQLIIDGITRLSPDATPEFSSKVRPLIDRMGEMNVVFTGGLGKPLNDCIATWMLRKFTKERDKYQTRFRYLKPLEIWLNWIAHKVANGETFTPLALPTHSGGWIDPKIWIKRLNTSEHIEPIDFKLSVLRLLPDGRAEARKKLDVIDSNYYRIAEFALGGYTKPRLEDKPYYSSWVTAARARSPRADWQESFELFEIIDHWPNSVQPALMEWHAEPENKYNEAKIDVSVFPKWISETQEETEEEASIKTTPFSWILSKIGKKEIEASIRKTTISKPDIDLLPASLLSIDAQKGYRWSHFVGYREQVDWMIQQWPAVPDGVQMQGAKNTTRRLNETSNSFEPSYGFYYSLFAPCQYWHEPALLLVALGLFARDADIKGLTVDAMIEGIEKGYFDPEHFVKVIQKLESGGWLKFGRLKDTLTPIIQASPLHAYVISRVLQDWLTLTDLKARNMFAPLEVLLEAQAVIRQPLSKGMIIALSNLKGNGKAGKLAKSLIALKDNDAGMRKHILGLAIQGRTQ
ncbi:DUF6493 family protein [Hellea sp.]|nr:DUF6493 family protein [Hellea sp.]